MSESWGALCSEHAINARLNLKMDLPAEREPVLAMFDRLRKEFAPLRQFKRIGSELCLESEPGIAPGRWVSLKRNYVRSGVIGPSAPAEALQFHRLVMEIAPYFLTISPIEVDYLELLFAFDLSATGNHDAIVHDALFGSTPLGRLLDVRGSMVCDCQPVFGIALDEDRQVEAHFEVKTRTAPPGTPYDAPAAPISVQLVLRRYGPVDEIAELPRILDRLTGFGTELVQSRVVPGLLLPIRQAISSHNA